MEIQRTRLARAVALIGVGLIAVAAAHCLEAGSRPLEAGAPAISAAVFADAVQGEGGDSAVRALLDGGCAAEAPPWFAEEVLAVEDLADLRANEMWSVVGFTRAEAPAETLAWCRHQLEQRGWILMESGVEGSLSAVKEEGSVSWLLLSCTAVADRTCIVIQVPTMS